jgi:antirestriction protein ArdC
MQPSLKLFRGLPDRRQAKYQVRTTRNRAGCARVAELGAAFLCADLGLSNEPRPDHAAYIASWLRVLKDDKRAIFTAASRAQAAADYLAGLQITTTQLAA